MRVFLTIDGAHAPNKSMKYYEIMNEKSKGEIICPVSLI
jgi:hypothetical protein